MSEKKPIRINRPLTEEERSPPPAVREEALRDFPPTKETAKHPSPSDIPTKIREAREARQLTWDTLAERAGVADQATIREIEQGKDVKLSDLERVAGALGLKLELVEVGA